MKADTSPLNMVYMTLSQIFETYTKKKNDGRLADYIPELSQVDPHGFGLAITTVDGFPYVFGNSDRQFTIQSVSKPFVYGMALQEFDVDHVIKKISVEPSGEAFNSISLYPDSGKPFNPMINAGAIAATGLLWEKFNTETFNRILETFSEYAGTQLTLNESIFQSEKTTGHRNRAIAHLLRNFNIIESEVEQPLDDYFKQCSINITCAHLSTMGATLANNGINPVTGRRVLDAALVPKVLSVMSTCGMYDYSGEWIYHVGLPAKSGVGGGVMAILPGQFAMATYSPLLDAKGNSVWGVSICRDIADIFSLHLYNVPRQTNQVVRRNMTMESVRSKFKRDPQAEELLNQFGKQVQIIELQGSLFFATCESFMRNIDSNCVYLILNLQKVTSMDDASRLLLIKLAHQMAENGQTLYLTQYEHLADLEELINDNSPCKTFPHHEQALYELEELLLLRHGYAPEVEPIELENQQLLKGLEVHEIAELKQHLYHRSYQKGAIIIHRDTMAQNIFFLESGKVTIEGVNENGKFVPIAVLSAGNSFGEMALLDKGTRSARVIAETDVACHVMLFNVLEKLQNSDAIKVKILTNLAAALSQRLRLANEEIAAFS